MTMYSVNGTDLTNIANAIRAKTGEVGTMTIADMPTEIGSISGGGGGVFTPTFTSTIIGTDYNATFTITLTDAYSNYDWLEVDTINSSTQKLTTFYVTPHFWDRCRTISNTKTNFNEPETNQYCTQSISSNGLTLTRTNYRSLQINEIRGIKGDNCNITATTLYDASSCTGSSITVSFSSDADFDYLFLGMNSSDSTEIQPNYRPISYNSALLFNDWIGKIHPYNTSQSITLTPGNLTAGRYFTVEGIKINPKQ